MTSPDLDRLAVEINAASELQVHRVKDIARALVARVREAEEIILVNDALMQDRDQVIARVRELEESLAVTGSCSDDWMQRAEQAEAGIVTNAREHDIAVTHWREKTKQAEAALAKSEATSEGRRKVLEDKAEEARQNWILLQQAEAERDDVGAQLAVANRFAEKLRDERDEAREELRLMHKAIKDVRRKMGV